MRGWVGVVVAAGLLAGAQVAWAQSNVATGMVLGTTVDPNGAALPGVTVGARNVATGLTRGAVSGGDGSYRIDLLPSGRYEVRASLSGFATELKRGVAVTLGSRVEVDFEMRLSPVEDEIVVTAETPMVETTNPSVGASVSDVAIANLPLYGRDFGDLVLLTPASVSGRSAQGDEWEIQGGHGGVNIGARAVHNSFNIDGATSQSSFWGNERGGQGSPFTFSQAAIKEFQVLQTPYDLQFSASGGVVNAITKSGTNELHGEVFAYYADDGFVEANALGEKADEFDQKQYGFALGGPIRRDRVHFFVSYDGQDLEEPSFRQFFNFPDGREADWEALTGLDWESETGTLIQTDDANVVLLKVDWQISESNLLGVRGNWMDYGAENRVDDSRSTGWSNNGVLENSYSSVVVSLSSVIAGDAFNELIIQHALEERPRSPHVTSIPATGIGWNGWDGWFGQHSALPNWLDEERLQIIDNLTLNWGRHTVKAGVNIDMVDFDNRFFRYAGGLYGYPSWEDFLDSRSPRLYIQAFSEIDGRLLYSNDLYAAYIQDEWRPRRGLTLVYGVRYDFQNHDQPRGANPLYPLTGQIPNDGDNWAPRVGFAWDIGGQGKQVLRGGVGVFYDSTAALLDAQPMLVNGVEVVRVTALCFQGDECPTWPDRWQSGDDLPAGIEPDIYVYDPNFENPETLSLSLGYERELFTGFSVGVDAIYSETEKLHRNQDQNLSPTGEQTVVGTPIYERGAVYPELGKITMFKSDARSHYKALVLRARKRYASDWFMDASYTWSSSRDQDSSERSVSSWRGRAEDQYNLGAEWGPSNFDAEHKLVISGGYRLPWNFMVSAIYIVRSGFPYTAAHWNDLNRDGYDSDRAVVEVSPGFFFRYPRNSERQPWFQTMNLRLSKVFRLGAATELEIIGEAFNVFNTANWWVSGFNQVLAEGCFWDDDGNWEPCSIDDDFGDKDIPGDPRHLQVGVKFRF